MATRDVELRRGLSGVYFDRTEASFIDGTEGKLLYRGYNIHDLAEKTTFEEVIYLLLYGVLPTREQLSEIDTFLRSNRGIPDGIVDIIRGIKDAHPMDVLRTAVSALSAFDEDVNDHSRESVIRKGLRITAKAPTIVATHHQIRNGNNPIPPDANLNHSGNFLKMLLGKEPQAEEIRLMDIDFILHAEHGANASAFATRVAVSTLTDLHAAIVAGIATLKGPLHGGAAESVMKMATEIGDPDKAEEWARNVLDNGGRIMGFGHRVYKAEDPRARHMREPSKELGEQKGQPKWFQILQSLTEVMKPYQARGIFVNVDFFAGSVYHLLGIPEDIFVPIFTLGRIPGWTLQAVEQYSNNILIRPLLQYTGPMDLPYTPMEER